MASILSGHQSSLGNNPLGIESNQRGLDGQKNPPWGIDSSSGTKRGKGDYVKPPFSKQLIANCKASHNDKAKFQPTPHQMSRLRGNGGALPSKCHLFANLSACRCKPSRYQHLSFVNWQSHWISTPSVHHSLLGINPLWASTLFGQQSSLGLNPPLWVSTKSGPHFSLGINPLQKINTLWATILSGSQPSLGNIPLLASTLSWIQPSLSDDPLWVLTLSGQRFSLVINISGHQASLGNNSLLPSSLHINPLWVSTLSGQHSSLGPNLLWATFLSWYHPSLGINPVSATILSGSQPSLGNIPLLTSTLSGFEPSLGLNPLWATFLSWHQPSLGINPL